MPPHPATRSLSRRVLLRAAAGATGLIACSSLLWPTRAQGSDLSLADRIKLLYSNQFHFNDRGQPQITVGLVSGVEEVTLSAPGGLVVMPSGIGGTTIDGGMRFTIRLQRARPARQQFAVVLEELAGSNNGAIDRAIARWKSKGFDPTDHEVGTVFGVSGHVLDNRRVLVVGERFTSEEEARRRAEALRQRHGAVAKLHPIVAERASGSLVAEDDARGLRVAAEGVLWFAAKDGGPITLHQVPVDNNAAPRTEAREYRGSVYVAIDRHGKLAVANLVSESDLLCGLVPAEIFASSPAAALRAQAVAARGQMLAKVGSRHLDDPFLLCAEQHCQVYAGRIREHERTNAAVRFTAGHVAMRPGQTQLVDTVYSANCGGHSEDNDVVWPSEPDPQLRGQPDPLLAKAFAAGITAANLEAWLRSTPKAYSLPPPEISKHAYRWREVLDPNKLAGNPGIPEELGRVDALEVSERGRSGRATRLRVTGKGGVIDIVGELRIRKALGGLRSSMFLVAPDKDGDHFVVHGGGHGHGVGLCQHGAMGMAEAGKSYEQILAHYYRGAKIVALW